MDSAMRSGTLVAFTKGRYCGGLVAKATIELLYSTRIAKMIAKLSNSPRIDHTWARLGL
jgi:hypothetical protein